MVRRFLAAVLVLAVAATLFVLTWPQFFGLQRAPGVAQATALRGGAVALAVLTAVLLTVLSLLWPAARRLLATISVLLLTFAAVGVIVLTVRGAASGVAPGPTGSVVPGTVTVLTWNTQGDRVSAGDIARLAVEQKATVVVLPETSRQTAEAVAAAARAANLPLFSWTVAFDETSVATSTSLLISADLGSYLVNEGIGSTSTMPSLVAVPTGGTGPVIVAAHAAAPVTLSLANWRSDLNWLAGQCQTDNVIMAGDFNATIDQFAGLGLPTAARNGAGGVTAPTTDLGRCVDAARVSGSAAIGTWPTVVPALLGAPIDHVLATTNWKFSAFRVFQDRDAAGSDHRPVLAQLIPAG